MSDGVVFAEGLPLMIRAASLELGSQMKQIYFSTDAALSSTQINILT
jgi:hypothetical protein